LMSAELKIVKVLLFIFLQIRMLSIMRNMQRREELM
jgi:hypothetical protein